MRCLAAVVLHDQRLIERRNFDLVASRQIENFAAKRTGVDGHPVRRPSRFQYFAIVREIGRDPGSPAARSRVARFDKERRNVGLAIINHEMAVPHQLPGLPPRVSETHAIDDIVETGLQNLQEVITGDAATPLSLYKVLVELALHDAVEPAHFLLLAQLKPEL